MYYQYKKLQGLCTPQGALTSNAKFIAPLAPVYYDKYTPMMKYPGPPPFRYQLAKPKKLKQPAQSPAPSPPQSPAPNLEGCPNCITRN